MGHLGHLGHLESISWLETSKFFGEFPAARVWLFDDTGGFYAWQACSQLLGLMAKNHPAGAFWHGWEAVVQRSHIILPWYVSNMHTNSDQCGSALFSLRVRVSAQILGWSDSRLAEANRPTGCNCDRAATASHRAQDVPLARKVQSVFQALQTYQYGGFLEGIRKSQWVSILSHGLMTRWFGDLGMGPRTLGHLQMEVSWNQGGTPSHHPFSWAFPFINQPFRGTSMAMEEPPPTWVQGPGHPDWSLQARSLSEGDGWDWSWDVIEIDSTVRSGSKRKHQCTRVILYDIIWYYMILYDIIWYYMILYDIIWYYMILYDIIWYYMILYDIIWYYMILWLVPAPSPTKTCGASSQAQVQEFQHISG